MKKEREPDLQFPDEAAIEERVRRMLDVTVPDVKEPAKAPIKPTDKPAPPSQAEALKDMPPKGLAINITSPDEPADEPISAPLLASDDTPKAAKAAPTPPKTVKKSITITHFTDVGATESSAKPGPGVEPESAPKHLVILPDETDAPLPSTDNPLLPTEKLTKVMEPSKAIRKSKAAAKKTSHKAKAAIAAADSAKVIEEAQGPVKKHAIAVSHDDGGDDAKPTKAETEPQATTPFDDLDHEIATAFAAETANELDELAAEEALPEEATSGNQKTVAAEETAKADEAATAPELQDAPSEAPELLKPKPKADIFKPLTTIRPQLPPDDPRYRPLKLDDAATSKAVEDIVALEADQLLDTAVPLRPSTRETQGHPLAHPKLQRSPSTSRRTKNFRKLVVAAVVVVLVAVAFLPASRAAGLNLLGVRTNASLKVLDQLSGQALKGASVSVDGQTVTTDASGVATMSGLKLGSTKFAITHRAYASTDLKADLGLKTNKLGIVSLVATGTRHTLKVNDYLTGQAVAAALDSSQGGGQGDSSGLIKLTLDKVLMKPFAATVSAPGYRPETITVDPTKSDLGTVNLVPAHKYTYVVNESGTLNVYAADLDGQHARLVLKGTGSEQAKTSQLVPSPSDNQAAVVSVRTATKAEDGSPISSLTLCNLQDGSTTTLGQGTQLQIIGWSGPDLVYTLIPSGSKPTDVARQQLLSYDFKSKKTTVLAKANYFNDVLVAGGKIFYAPSSAYQPTSNVGFFEINADGSGKLGLLALETWNVYRTSLNHLSLSVQQDWYDFKLGDRQVTKLSAAPAVLNNFVYVESPDGQRGVRVDTTGSQATLLLSTRASDKDTTLLSRTGLRYPVQWLGNNVIMYRLTTSQEVADYAYSPGGAPKKIHDVVDIAGLSAWQVH